MPRTRPFHDMAIIGSGAAAFAAAIAAAGKGKSVALVERGTIGGTCVNVGCVPSKALLAAAEALHSARTASRFPGVHASAGPLDMPELIAGKDALVARLREEKYVDLAASHGFEVIRGSACFADGPSLDVLRLSAGGNTVERIEAAHYVIATGSAPWVPTVHGLTGAGYLTSTTAMQLVTVPESLIVVGGGSIGLEQAQHFARLGAQVTLVEAQDRLAPVEEPEISESLLHVLVDDGISVHTSSTLVSAHRDTRYTLTIAGPDGTRMELHAEQLLMATGRRSATAGLHLERVGVETGSRGEVVVDEHLRTGNPRIWAAGDVTGHPQYVYVAAAHGTLVADNAFDLALRSLDYGALPRVTFTSPAIASVGLTQVQASQAGIPSRQVILPLQHVPRAIADRDDRGLLKLVAHATNGTVLGVHVLATSSGEIITAAGYAIAAGMTVHQLAHSWHPYLTMAEALKLAAQGFSADITRLSCCAG